MLVGIQGSTTLVGIQESTTLVGIQESTTLVGIHESNTLVCVQEPNTLVGAQESNTLVGAQESNMLVGIQESNMHVDVQLCFPYFFNQRPFGHNIFLYSPLYLKFYLVIFYKLQDNILRLMKNEYVSVSSSCCDMSHDYG